MKASDKTAPNQALGCKVKQKKDPTLWIQFPLSHSWAKAPASSAVTRGTTAFLRVESRSHMQLPCSSTRDAARVFRNSPSESHRPSGNMCAVTAFYVRVQNKFNSSKTDNKYLIKRHQWNLKVTFTNTASAENRLKCYFPSSFHKRSSSQAWVVNACDWSQHRRRRIATSWRPNLIKF